MENRQVMTEHKVKPRSRLTTAAIVMAGGLIPYYLIALISMPVLDSLFAKCDRQDFGGCAMQNLFLPFVELILMLIIFIVFPLAVAALSAIFALVGHSRNKAQKISGELSVIK